MPEVRELSEEKIFPPEGKGKKSLIREKGEGGAGVPLPSKAGTPGGGQRTQGRG